MNYRDFQQKRVKSSIVFYGYTRSLNRNSRQRDKYKFDENFDLLDNLFNIIQNEVNMHFNKKMVTTSTSLSSVNLKRIQSSMPNRVQKAITVDLNANGESSLALTSTNLNIKSKTQQKSVKIENHVANYDVLLTIKSKLENKLSDVISEDEKIEIEERIKNINGYLDLIKFCFKYLGKSGDDVKDVESDYFQVVSKDPIEVSIENSKVKYSIEDIITRYIQSLSTSANQETLDNECKKIIIATPAEYSIFEKTELKKCVENAGLELQRIVSKPVAKILSVTPNPIEKLKHTKNILIDFNSGPLTVTLYEANKDKNTKIVSSLVETTLKTENLNELNKNILVNKNLIEKDNLGNVGDIIQKCVDEIDKQFQDGYDTAFLKWSKDSSEVAEIDRDEIEEMLTKFLEQTYRLIKAILYEQDLDINDLSVVNYCSFYYKFLIGEMLKKYFPRADPKIFHGEREYNISNGVGAIAHKIAMTGTDCINNTLSCNLGIGEFRGIFVKQLLRGANLPCSNSVLLNTIIDYQESCLIEIYQGERPFSRYCNLLGTLTINDLPIDKAYKVEIEVMLSIDKDEVLTVKAIELRTNKKLTVIIEKGKMKSDNANMVLDALENKESDEELMEKLDEINDLIENARTKFENTEYEALVFDKMNDFVSWITERKKTIDVTECLLCINKIHKYFDEHHLDLN